MGMKKSGVWPSWEEAQQEGEEFHPQLPRNLPVPKRMTNVIAEPITHRKKKKEKKTFPKCDRTNCQAISLGFLVLQIEQVVKQPREPNLCHTHTFTCSTI